MWTFLFDKYTDNVKKLQETMQYLGINARTIVLEDEAFLPREVTSLFEYFISSQNREEHKEYELFYAFLDIPEFWEVRMVGDKGGIYDMGCEKAVIYFTEPIEKRIVQRVEWHTEDGRGYRTDYYNKYGLKYASEFIDTDGNVESKVYYSDGNQEVIVSQPQNDVIILLENSMVKEFFSSYHQFLEFYLEKIKTEDGMILFIQEKMKNELLNLKVNGNSPWDAVLFSDNDLLKSYKNAGGERGYRFYAIPEQYPVNHRSGNAMILTASDQIEKLEELVQELPEVVFHIAAHTQMSEKLYILSQSENVKIYPGISKIELDRLWDECDFYLDINHYREIDDAVNEAVQKNLLIMGFENLLHQQDLFVKTCVFQKDNYKKIVSTIRCLKSENAFMQELLTMQQQARKEVWENILQLSEKRGD